MHGNYPTAQNLSANDLIVRLFATGGKLGVNIFVLISGYFLIDSKFRIKKLVNIFTQVSFYSLLIVSLFLIFGKAQYSYGLLINMLFPVSTNVWWFITSYVIMYCLSPFLNILIKNCSKKLHLLLILFLLTLQCVIQIVFEIGHISNAGWFVTLYLIAAYIKIYPCRLFNSNKILLPVGLCAYVLMIIFKMFLNVDLWQMTTPICLLCSVAVFCSFKNFKIPNSKIINCVAKSTFGIYLIHDHYLMRNFIWVETLNCPFHYQISTFICFSVIAVILVFTVCMLLDFARELLFKGAGKIINIIIDKTKAKRKNTIKENEV